MIRILAGMLALIPAQIESPRQASPGEITQLPPYVVAARPIRQLPPLIPSEPFRNSWGYANIPGFEILSSLGLTKTQETAEEIYRQQTWLDELVPRNLQAESTVPTAIILFGNNLMVTMSHSIETLMRANARSGAGGAAHAGTGSSLPGVLPSPEGPWEMIPQVTLWDTDSTSVEIMLKDDFTGRRNSVQFDPEYVLHILASRAPHLPEWFKVGIVGLYQTRLPDPPPGALGNRTNQYFGPANWISPEAASVWRKQLNGDIMGLRALMAQGRAPQFPTLLPLEDVLLGEPPKPGSEDEKLAWLAKHGHQAPNPSSPTYAADLRSQVNFIFRNGADQGSPWRRDVWNSEAMIFTRWAFDDATLQRRKSLWAFAAESATTTADEALFKECFGAGVAEVGKVLEDYIIEAIPNGHFQVFSDRPLEYPYVEVRDPTDAEEARLLGDWQRKEAEDVRSFSREYADQYAIEAGRTLNRAYDDGIRDPGLLAALGLFECSVGNDARADYYLEGAVRAGVTRPRAYVELARIRLAASIAAPRGFGGRLDRAQAAAVVDLLRKTALFQPPQRLAFLLAAYVWEHADFIPAPADLQLLDEGLHFFPDDAQLILASAQLNAAAGLKSKAAQILDLGLREVPDPKMRTIFSKLRTGL